ncbi:MAG: BlaI/MecI/CopY family transcriptional regulator [Thaumarchaeota archaeon]|nr:BlaI/MecI/CopY family transcriptional regulator [Nitrososphaerota archaeon]
MQKKVKIEFQDDSGARYSLAVEGRVSREKVLKIMDLMELVEGENGITEPPVDGSTVFGKLMNVINESFAGKEFSSADVARDYEEKEGAHIPLSTVSTYLSRLATRGTLKRQKFGNSWVYRQVYLHAEQALKP